VGSQVSRRGITIASRKPVGETPLARHQKFVEEVRSAGRSIELGVCPNDKALMVDGVCPSVGCMFRILVGQPPVISDRVAFHRRASRHYTGDMERML
jgi:hypothetical protein